MSQTFLAKRPHEKFEKFKEHDTWQQTAMCQARRMKEHKTGQECNDMSRT